MGDAFQLAVEFELVPVGEVGFADGKLEFPQLPERPGIYMFEFIEGAEQAVYVGETDRLRRRMTHYRNPGKSQQTNIRLNPRMKAHFAVGGRIAMSIVTAARADGQPLDLSAKAARLLVENALLLTITRRGCKAENL